MPKPKLVIICEGYAEKKSLSEFLRPFWEKRFRTAVIDNRRGKNKFKNEYAMLARKYLADSEDTYVLCLIDMLEEPFKLGNAKSNIEENFVLIQRQMNNAIEKIHRKRFAAFPIMMELETWLIADLEVMKEVGVKPPANPESIERAADWLKERWEKQAGRYFTKGKTPAQLFEKASAQRVYEDNCPHFVQLADWLQGK